MLQAASSIAPRGVYVCGNTTTAAGLTVTLHKDAQTGKLHNVASVNVYISMKATMPLKLVRSFWLTRVPVASTNSTR